MMTKETVLSILESYFKTTIPQKYLNIQEVKENVFTFKITDAFVYAQMMNSFNPVDVNSILAHSFKSGWITTDKTMSRRFIKTNLLPDFTFKFENTNYYIGIQ